MLGFVKMSFVLFYRRLFCTLNGSRTFHLITLGVCGLVIAWAVGFWFTLFFICGVDFSAWFTSVAQTTLHCPGTLKFQVGYVISDAITDVIVFILPIHRVSHPCPTPFSILFTKMKTDMETSHVYLAQICNHCYLFFRITVSSTPLNYCPWFLTCHRTIAASIARMVIFVLIASGINSIPQCTCIVLKGSSRFRSA